MPKRKSKETNSSPSSEVSAPQKPAIVRIVKQKTTVTSSNSPAPSKPLSTAELKENQNSVPELDLNNSQNPKMEVASEESSTVPVTPTVTPRINAALDNSSLPSTVETTIVNEKALVTTEENQVSDLVPREPDSQQPQLDKFIPPYKKLETVTNNYQQTFAVGEEIQVSTCNVGSHSAVITFLYEAPDGSIWASYYPVEKSHQRLWRRGCCRIEYLKKLDENSSSSDSCTLDIKPE